MSDKPPSMESAVLNQLFRALARARVRPTYFRVLGASPNGLEEKVVLVFDRQDLPLIGGLNAEELPK